MNCGDVGMIQRSQHLRFALKPGKPLGIVRKSFRQDLDGHIAPQLGVLRAVHLAHPACANGREDFVGAHALAGVNCQWLPLIAEVGELYNLSFAFGSCGFLRGPGTQSLPSVRMPA